MRTDNPNDRFIRVLFSALIVASLVVSVSASSLVSASAETSQTTIVQEGNTYESNNFPTAAVEKAGSTKIEPRLGKLSENIQRRLEQKEEDEIVRIIVRLEPADLGDVPETMVVNKLKEHANRTQEPVIEFLQTQGAIILNKFWLANAILAEVKVSTIRDLTSFSSVRKIHEDFLVRILKVSESSHNHSSIGVTPFEEARDDIQVRALEVEGDYTSHRSSDVTSVKGVRENFQVGISEVSEDIVISSPSGATWGLVRIRAVDTWELDFDGSDIRVAVLDTGVEITHPDLVGKMWTDNPADPTYPGGWIEFDSNGNIVIGSKPYDTDGHGTHTSGTVLGDNASGTAIGVAPGAWLMHGLILPGGGGTFAQVLAGMQWAIAPTDQYGNPAGQRADVASMSWGAEGYWDDLIEPIINMKAAGVVPVAAIGNYGEGTSDSPGNVYEAFGIGAIDVYDAVAGFSGGEVINKQDWLDPPADWPNSYIKPDFSAPGVDVYSSVPWGYVYWDGTSMATPHVAGTIALMLDANSTLTVDDIYDVLKLTSDDLGNPGKDIRYGWGVIDAFDATSVVQFNSGIQGYVVNALTSEGIAGAKVVVQETGWTRYTTENGYYRIFLLPDNYTLTVSAFGYYDNTAAANVVENQWTTLDIALAPLPTGFISGDVTDEALNPIENATVTLLGTPLSTITDNAGNYVLEAPIDNYDVKASAWGYRPAFAYGVEVLENQTTVVNFQLESFIALLIQDLPPWETDSNGIALEEFEIAYDVITSSMLDTWNLSKYNFIMYSSDQLSSYYVNIANNLDRISSYIIDGGLLIAHSCDGGWNGGDWRGLSILPGGVTHLMYFDGWEYISQNIHITDNSHEVVTGCGAFTLTDEYLSGWNYSTGGIYTDLVAGTNVVMVSSDNDGDGPTYLDYNYGGGKVLATMQPVEWGYSWIGRPELLRNELRFVLKWSPPPQGVMGYVMDEETLKGISGAEIFVQETGWVTHTLENGYYKIFLPPDNYTLTVSAFGYYDNTVAVSIIENQWITLDINLAPLPTGFISGEVTDNVLNPIENATISLLGTPLSTTTDNVGNYILEAPIDNYDAKASAWGYKSATVYGVEVLENQTTVVNFQLEALTMILFDQTHGTDSITWYSIWVENLTERGYVVETHTSGPITPTVLEGYGVFVIPQAHYGYTSDELSAIESFVLEGDGLLLVIGDDDPWIYTSLTSFAGITWASGGYSGYTSDITPHPVTEGVTTAYFGAPVSQLYVAPPAEDLIRDNYGKTIMLAVSGAGLGKVLGIADEDSIRDGPIGYANNLRLANNMIDWFATRYEHDLAVSLVAPAILEPGDSSLLEATVYNSGLNNENDVELQLLINGTIVDSVIIPELLTGSSYTLNYLWTPTVEGTYDVEAYAPPVPDEKYTGNNVATKTVEVRPIKGYILFDQTHGTDLIKYYSMWVENLTERGYVVETHTSGPITPTVLEGYDVFVIPQAHYSYTSDELFAIENFVLDGGGLLVIGDDNPWIYTSLTSFAGITWASGGYGGYSSDITPHPVTEGVTTAYFGAPVSQMYVAPPAVDLIRDDYEYIMLAVSVAGLGKVMGIADEDSIRNGPIGYANNLQLANNMIDWFVPPHGVTGYVMDEETLIGIAGAEIFIQETGWAAYTSENGYYNTFLPPGSYTLTVSAFGYYDNIVSVGVVENQWTTLDIALASRPTGFISGEVTDEALNPIENVTIAPLGTPLSTITDNTGNYVFEAPIGSYDVKASAWGYRPAFAYGVEVLENQTTVVNFQLESFIALLIQDLPPWGTYSNSMALEEFEIAYDVINSSVLNTWDLSEYNFIMYSSDQPGSYYVNIANNLDSISSYIINGGLLIAHSCDGGWNGGDWRGLSILPGGVTHLMYFDGGKYTSNIIHITDNSHEVITGCGAFTLTDSYLSGWSWSTHGIFTDLVAGTNEVMISNDGDGDGPTYVDYDYGIGKVLATMQTVEWGYSGRGKQELLRNELRFALKWSPPPFRVSVSILPSENEGLVGENVTFIATVANTGTIQDNYDLTISDNSGWAPMLSEDSLEDVQPTENRQVTICVTIPESAAPCTEDNITFTATSQENAEVSDDASCIAHVKVVRGVDISISPSYQRGPPKATLYYTVTVTNTGNVEDTYDLSVSDMGWYNASWSYRRPVTIENPGGALENYQVKVFVSYDSDMLENFDDLRFVDNDQITELPYWIENYNLAGDATVWVKVPSLPADDSKTVWMYYGNPGASSASDGDATFEFFDDMESGIEKWVTDGLWHLTTKKSCSLSHSFWYGLEGNNNYDTGTANSGSLETDELTGALSARLELCYWREVESYSGAFDQTIIYDSVDGSTWNQIWYKDSRDVSEKAWTFLAIDLTPSARYLEFYFDTVDSVANDFWGWFIDDVRVRTCALPEPATSVGEENSYLGWSPSISPPSLTLAPGASQDATLSVTIPENALPCTEDNITVTATSQADSKIKNSAICVAHCIRVEFDASITATFSGSSDDAVFSVRLDATSGFDNAYDMPEPPPPVAPPYVRTFFYYPEQSPDKLHRSCLAPENWMEWPLRIEYAEDVEDVILTWNVEDVPAEYSSIFLYRDENLVADMRAEDNFTFEASTGSYDFKIVVGKLLPFALELGQGWNMISFPVLPENSSPDSIFGSYYALYEWDAEDKQYVLHSDSGSFIEPDPDVEAGVGYWAYVLENENVDLLGVPVSQLILSLYQGWNLIGPPYGGSSIADPSDDPDNSVLPWALTWNSSEKSYSMTQLLEAGKGYWAYALQDCTLTQIGSGKGGGG